MVNAAEEDRTKSPRLLSRSLACLRLELNQTRCATSSKLRQCYEKRADDNAKVVDVLHNNMHLWKHVGGPDPEQLFRPSATHDMSDGVGGTAWPCANTKSTSSCTRSRGACDMAAKM